MRIVVTEVTDMSPGTHCVAAYDEASMRMIRPKPNGENWTSANIKKLGVAPGRVLILGNSAEQQVSSHLPHKNEDFYVKANDITSAGNVRPEPQSFNSLQECFDNNVVGYGSFQGFSKAYVEDAKNCPSLSGLNVTAKKFKLYLNAYEGKFKLRAKFLDSELEGWDMGVTSSELKSAIGHDQDKINQFNADLGRLQAVHLRVGLARRFPAQKYRCFVQLNGVII